MARHAIFINGTIGSGKTTLGRGLAAALGGGFIDGDDCADPTKPWYASLRVTSARIVRAGFAILETQPVAVIAYPLGCTTWIYHRRKFGDAGVRPIFITLRASYENITSSGRGRVFAQWEHDRIRTMLREGYDQRAFSDAIVDTDRAGFDETLVRLTETVRKLVANTS